MLKSITELLAATPTEIMNAAEAELTRIGYEVRRDPADRFLFAIPPQLRGGVDKLMNIFTPLLCSHVDVVGVTPPERGDIIVDVSQNRLSLKEGSKAQVLGADDRAGIFAMFKIVHSLWNKLPFVVLTDGEEMGGIGAGALADSENLAEFQENISCFIELDRRGVGEFVSYDPSGEPNEDLRRLFEEQGFSLGHGSYSDVADFTPVVGVSNVNLSVGYRHEHTQGETLFLDDLELTVSRVLRMWVNCPDLFSKRFEAEPDTVWKGGGFGLHEDWDFRLYDQIMDSVYQLSADARVCDDIPALVDRFINELGSDHLQILVESLEDIVDDLYYSGDATVSRVADALVGLLVLGDNSEEEEEEDLDFLDCPDGFCVNSRGTVVGRTLNRAGGF